MTKHEWREEREDGVHLYYRAVHHGGNWTISSFIRGEGRRDPEEEKVHYDPVPTEVWKKLREVLFNKYQRGRCPWNLIVKIDKRLEKLSEES